MASANLRYQTLRPRLAPLLQAFARGEQDDHTFATALLSQLYRALAHHTALAVFAVQGDQLIALATHGPFENHELPREATVPGAALTMEGAVVVPFRDDDRRAAPTQRPFGAELAVALRRPPRPTLVLDLLIEDPRALGYADRELFSWIGHVVHDAATHADDG